eukprot:TRINITY_DN41198_c0_g1_i1.p1 TRINITY_DN41198_c0_g1~~TRINITY_DN41198_c0_g1_i1.p1  ORF type:complete len:317 (+),score=35.82 TRINITY_DN41198_c0_g1_i1:11-961(+)
MRRSPTASAPLMDQVLQHPDLLGAVMSILSLCDSACAQVCTTWAAHWHVRLTQLCVIKPGPTHQPGAPGALTILVLSDGRVVIGCDSSEHQRVGRVEVYSSLWEPLLCITGHFVRPYGLSHDPTQPDVLHVVDCERVRSVSLCTGGLLRESAVLRNPCSLERTPVGGTLFVAEHASGSNQIHGLDPNHLTVQHSFGSDLCGITELARPEQGTLLVAAETGARRAGLWQYAVDGTLLSIIWMDSPASSLVCSRGLVFYLEVDTLVVQVLRLGHKTATVVQNLRIKGDVGNLQTGSDLGIVDICVLPDGHQLLSLIHI